MSLPPPTPEQWTAISKLVSSILQRPEAEPFREPVDWQRLGLYDYPKIIKKPMDLGTIKKRITDRKYKNIKSIDDDVKLVWTNCTTYNADGSDFFILAQNLNKKWVDKFSKFCNDFQLNPVDGTSTKAGDKKGGGGDQPTPSGATSSQSGAGGGAGGAASVTSAAGSSNAAGGGSSSNIANNPNSKTSLDEKRSFARSLYKISKEDLGRVLVEVELKCPAALTKNSAEDEVEFNVDKLTPQVFADLVVFVKNCSSSGGGGGGGGGSGAGGGAANGSSSGAVAGAATGDAASTGGNKSKKKSSSSSGGSKRQKT